VEGLPSRQPGYVSKLYRLKPLPPTKNLGLVAQMIATERVLDNTRMEREKKQEIYIMYTQTSFSRRDDEIICLHTPCFDDNF